MIGKQMPTSEATLATLRGFTNTLDDAAAAARRTGVAARKGQPFNCVRGQGRLTLAQCLERFLGGHPVCARDCGCSLGKRAVEKVKPATEEAMSYRDKYGDCACGKTGVKLDKHGRCYKCQEVIREAAKQERKARVLAPKAYAQAEPIVAVQGVQEPDAGQGCPKTAGRMVIDGMEFEAFTPRKKPDLKPFLSLHAGKTFNFSPGAVRQFGLLQYRFVEMLYSRSGRAIAFILHEQPDGAGSLSLYASKSQTRARVGAQGFMAAFNLDLKGKGPWPLKQPQPGVLVARVG
jgi:hypothetical protein